MTRTDSVASSRLQSACAASTRGRLRRGLLVLPVVFVLSSAAPSFAAEPLSGYKQNPKPTGETKPSTSSKKPKHETSTATQSQVPSSSTTPSSNSTLPFTGLDLRWVIGAGVLLLGMGLTIRLVGRREHSGG